MAVGWLEGNRFCGKMGPDNVRFAGGNAPAAPPPIPTPENSSLPLAQAQKEALKPRGSAATYLTQRGLGTSNLFRQTLLGM